MNQPNGAQFEIAIRHMTGNAQAAPAERDKQLKCARGHHLNRVSALRRISLGELIAILFLGEGTVEGLFKDGFGVNNLKLGPEVPGVMGDGAAVGAAPRVGEGKVFIRNLLGKGAPVGRRVNNLCLVLGYNVDDTPSSAMQRVSCRYGYDVGGCTVMFSGGEGGGAYQLPLPAPSFLIFLGSTSAYPLLAK